MQPTDKRSITDIDGASKPTGVIVRKVSFNVLIIVIDVASLVLKEEIPSRFSINDMLKKTWDLHLDGSST